MTLVSSQPFPAPGAPPQGFLIDPLQRVKPASGSYVVADRTEWSGCSVVSSVASESRPAFCSCTKPLLGTGVVLAPVALSPYPSWPWAGVEGTRGRPCCTLLPVAGALECEIPTRKVSFSHSFPENASGLCLLACLVPIGQCTADGAGHCPEQPVSALGPGTHGPCGPPVQHCSWISRHLLDFRTARN